MEKTFTLSGLDCGNCAAKMERAIAKIPGVTRASVNFMTQRLVLDAPEGEWLRVLSDVQAAISKILPTCKMN